MKRFWSLLFLIIGAVPLLVYPFVIIANIMQLAAGPSGEENILLIVIVKLFIVCTSTYLLTYLICLVSYIRKKSRRLLFSLIPLIHLAIAWLLFILWEFLS
jgi:hypothetical protein